MSNDTGTRPTRRTVLKRLATTATVAGAGLGGTTTRVAGRRSVAVDRLQAESLLAAHGGDLLDLLAEEGLVASDADLPTARRIDDTALAAGVEGATMLVRRGRPTELNVVREVDAGTLTVTIEPATGRSYAVLDDGERKRIYDPAEDLRGLAPANEECCFTDCDCLYSCCSAVEGVEDCTTTCGPCPESDISSQRVYTSDHCGCPCPD